MGLIAFNAFSKNVVSLTFPIDPSYFIVKRNFIILNTDGCKSLLMPHVD